MERKAVRIKYKAARVKPRLDELTFGTFHILTAAVFGVDGIDTLLRDPVLRRVLSLLGFRRPKVTEIPNSWHLDTAFFPVVIAAGIQAAKCKRGRTCEKGGDR